MTTETIACVVQVKLEYETAEQREDMVRHIVEKGPQCMWQEGCFTCHSEACWPCRLVPTGLAERCRIAADHNRPTEISEMWNLLAEAAAALEVGG